MCKNKIFDEILNKVLIHNVGRAAGKTTSLKQQYKEYLDSMLSTNMHNVLLQAYAVGLTAEEIVDVSTAAILKTLNFDLHNPLSMETCYGCVDNGKCGIRTMHGCPSKKVLPFGTEVADWFAGHKIHEEQERINDFKKEYEGTWIERAVAVRKAGCHGICDICNKIHDCPDRDNKVFKKEDIDKCIVIKTYDKSKDNCNDCTVQGCGIFTREGCSWKEVPQDLNYTDIYKQFINSNPALNDAVNDWRPEGSMSMSMSILVWLKNNFNHTLVVSMNANNNLSYEWRYKGEEK